MKVAGKTIGDGIGTHAAALLVYDVPANAVAFKATGGLDNGGTNQSGAKSFVEFFVFDKNPSSQ